MTYAFGRFPRTRVTINVPSATNSLFGGIKINPMNRALVGVWAQEWLEWRYRFFWWPFHKRNQAKREIWTHTVTIAVAELFEETDIERLTLDHAEAMPHAYPFLKNWTSDQILAEFARLMPKARQWAREYEDFLVTIRERLLRIK